VTTFDIVLVLVIAGAFVLGFLWGVIRSLLMLAGWLAVFLLSALLSVPAGDYLTGQWSAYDTHWNHMAAFAILYFAGLVLAAILIWIGVKGAQGLSKYRLLDDVVSGSIMAIVAVLGIAGLIVILATAYRGSLGFAVIGPDWTREVYQALLDSRIGDGLTRTVIPLLGTLLGPLLPGYVRQVMV
jgi:putative Mn2+ efflux pump MntP